jgi:hypothetical protein
MEKIKDSDIEKIIGICPKNVSESKIWGIYKKRTADSGKYLREASGNRNQHHAYPEAAKPSLDGYDISILGDSLAADKYDNTTAKKFPQNKEHFLLFWL